MKQVTLFGGGFNPPHMAHLFTVTYLLSRHDVDEIWLLPAYKHAFDKALQPFAERVMLLRKLFAKHERVKICEIEAEQNLSGKTFDTLERLSELYPDNQFSLSIGSDNLAVADRWYRFDELITRWRLIVMLRPGFELSQSKVELDQKHEVWPANLPAVSSSQIRQTLAQINNEPDWSKEPLSWLPSLIQKEVIRLYSFNYSSEALADEETSRLIHKPKSQAEKSIYIWGQGRCGLSLHHYFKSQGLRSYGLSLRQFIEQDRWNFDSNQLKELLGEAIKYDIWIFACKDDLIQSLSKTLCQTLNTQFTKIQTETVRPKLALHCSGSRPSSLLASFEYFNWKVAQFHPLYSFKSGSTHPRDLQGLHIALSSRKQIKNELIELVNSLKFIPLDLDDISLGHLKTTTEPELFLSLYHCAAVFGANLSLTPFLFGEEILEKLRFPTLVASQAFQALYRSALTPFPFQEKLHTRDQQDEVLSLSARRRFKEALTGPIARDDVQTLQLHLNSLRKLEVLSSKETLHTQLTDHSQLLSESYLLLSFLTAKVYQSPNCINFLESELKALF